MIEINNKNLKEIRRTEDSIILQYNSKQDAIHAYNEGFEKYVMGNIRKLK